MFDPSPLTEHARTIAESLPFVGAVLSSSRAAHRPSPAPVPVPEPARRARGVYLGKDIVPGTVILLVYDRLGRRLSRAELLEAVYTPATFRAFEAWLDLVDPETPTPPLRLAD